MKKLFTALLGMACIGLMTACTPGEEPENGGNDNDGTGKDKDKTENVTPEQMKEKGYALKYTYYTLYGQTQTAIYSRKGASTRLDLIYMTDDDEGQPYEAHHVYIETKMPKVTTRATDIPTTTKKTSGRTTTTAHARQPTTPSP